jgi:hypothetical protein
LCFALPAIVFGVMNVGIVICIHILKTVGIREGEMCTVPYDSFLKVTVFCMDFIMSESADLS